MNYKALAVGAVLGFVLAVSPACGGGGEGPSKCDASSCPQGCCDPLGKCVTATTPGQCGTQGQNCFACASGQSCQAGICTVEADAGTLCSPATCPGCCSGSICLPGTAPAKCGHDGVACVTCGAGQECLDVDGTGPKGGECSTASTPEPYGASCDTPSQCTAVPVANPANRMCKTETTFGNLTYPGGYCTRRCYDDDHCGDAGLCLVGFGVLGEADNICLDRCVSNSDCRSGYLCINFGTSTNPQGACWVPPPDGGTRYEFVDGGPGADAGVMGNACSAGPQCQPPDDGFCISQSLPDGGPSGYPGGSCSADCTYGGDDHCGSTGTCVLYLTVNDPSGEIAEVVGLCEAACTTTASTCRSGYYCAAFSSSSTAGYCNARCDSPGNSCPTQFGFTCNTNSGRCCHPTQGCL